MPYWNSFIFCLIGQNFLHVEALAVEPKREQGLDWNHLIGHVRLY